MGFDFFTIHHLATELDAQLTGKRLTRAGARAQELGLEVKDRGYLHVCLGRDGWVCLCPGALP